MTQINKNQDIRSPFTDFIEWVYSLELNPDLQYEIVMRAIKARNEWDKKFNSNKPNFKVTDEEFGNHDCHASEISGCEVCYQYFYERGQI